MLVNIYSHTLISFPPLFTFTPLRFVHSVHILDKEKKEFEVVQFALMDMRYENRLIYKCSHRIRTDLLTKVIAYAMQRSWNGRNWNKYIKKEHKQLHVVGALITQSSPVPTAILVPSSHTGK